VNTKTGGQILQFLTAVLANAKLTCIVATEQLCVVFLCVCCYADTEAVVVVSSALGKNGVFYVMPTLSAETAYMMTKISDRIR